MKCDCVAALVGRERELAVLRSAFDGLRAGRAQVVLVEGEPGIGKTSLVRAAIGALAGTAEPRVEVVWATAEDDAGAGGPGAPLLEALGCEPGAADRRRAVPAVLLDGGRSPGALPDLVLAAPDLHVRVREHLVQLIRELAVEHPLVLVVDDAHWADPTTVQVLTQLARRPGSEPVALVVVTRPAPGRADLARLLDALADGGASLVHLDHLDPGEVTALATDTLGVRPGPRLTDALAGAGGSPFLVLELLRSLQAEGAVRLSGGRADLVEGAALPLAFRLSLRRRLGTLPTPDRALTVLRVAAVLGPTFDPGELATVLDRPMVELVGVLDDALAAGVLVEAGRHLAFRHALLRETVYRDIPEGIRGALHADAARALARAGAPSARVAGHVERADRTEDDQAAAWLEQAAAETVRAAPARAVELLERARTRLGAVDHRPALDLELGRALTWSGRPVEAAEVIRGVLAEPGGAAVEARARPLLAAALLLGGQVAGAVQQLDLALLGEGLSPVDRARLRAEGAFGRFITGDLDGAARAAGQAIAEADGLGDGVARCLAASCLSWCVYARGDIARALALAADAVTAGAGADGDDAQVTGRYAPHLFLAVPLMIADRFEESAAALATARRACEQAGTVSLLPAIHSVSALNRLLVGEWDDALADVETGLSWADDVGSRLGVLWLHAIRAHVALHRGERAQAEAAVAAAHAELDRGGPQTGVDWLLWARALLLADEDPTTAAQTLGAVWDAYESVGVIGNRTGMGPDLVRLALAAGDRDRAAAVTLAVEEAAARYRVGSVEVAACRCRALLDGDTGRGARAVELARGGPRLLQWAAACEEQAVLLRSGADGPVSGRRVQQLIDEAQEVYGRMGAAADIARLAIAVGPRRSPARPARPVSGWRSLTPTEEKVAALVAAGLSNREIGERLFISPRTVETHIAHAFRKLDLSSRVELATGAVAHGLTPGGRQDQA